MTKGLHFNSMRKKTANCLREETNLKTLVSADTTHVCKLKIFLLKDKRKLTWNQIKDKVDLYLTYSHLFLG